MSGMIIQKVQEVWSRLLTWRRGIRSEPRFSEGPDLPKLHQHDDAGDSVEEASPVEVPRLAKSCFLEEIDPSTLPLPTSYRERVERGFARLREQDALSAYEECLRALSADPIRGSDGSGIERS